MAGSFDAKVGGTWISEPKVLAFSNSASKDAMSVARRYLPLLLKQVH